MRKSIENAIEFYRKSQSLNADAIDNTKNLDALMKTKDLKSTQKKIFEITIVKADIRERPDKHSPKVMQTFYYFDFYTFGEYHSATVPGPNPLFEITSRYEIEYNNEFVDYLKTMNLPINFIDESVDLNNNETPNDLIGKAYLPLKDIISRDM